MIKVGFVLLFDGNWMGGENYFRSLFSALYVLPERTIEPIVFTGFGTPVKQFDGFPPLEIVRSQLFDRGSLPWLLRKVLFRGLSNDVLLERLLRKHGVAVLSHSGWLGKAAAIPTIGWIPDFQHARRPEYFGAREIASRDNDDRELCRYCTTIIVSSFDAHTDLHRFYPARRAKSEVLQFVVARTQANETIPTREELQQRYGFSGNYFLLPNQLWKHKNHGVVIEALGLLGRECKKVLVVGTGGEKDYRHPEYFNTLMARAKELDVLVNFRHLGLVPASDLAGLMRDTLAIINPSFFEGWSTTVEEAKSLGTRVILSDIPVHREQNPPLGSYFPPDDANTLATILWAVWNESATNSILLAEVARQAADERRLEFAQKYQDIVISTLENHSGRLRACC